MGTFKRIIFSIMTLILILLGAVFVSAGLIRSNLLAYFIYYLEDSKLRLGLMLVGIVLLVFATFILIDLILSSDVDFEYLRNQEDGSILVKRSSLENTLAQAVRRAGLKPLSQDVRILKDGEKIKASAKVQIDNNKDLNLLTDKVKTEARKSLGELTGISDIDLSLYFQKMEKSLDEKKG